MFSIFDLILVTSIIWVPIWIILSILVGVAIGKKKGRIVAGCIWGLLLGPFGWLLVGLGPNHTPKCPLCDGYVSKNAIKCKNCGSDLEEL